MALPTSFYPWGRLFQLATKSAEMHKHSLFVKCLDTFPLQAVGLRLKNWSIMLAYSSRLPSTVYTCGDSGEEWRPLSCCLAPAVMTGDGLSSVFTQRSPRLLLQVFWLVFLGVLPGACVPVPTSLYTQWVSVGFYWASSLLDALGKMEAFGFYRVL